MAKRSTWRFSCGIKAVNRVTVYERLGRPCLSIEWWDGSGERNQRSLKYHTGLAVPNTDEGRMFAVMAAKKVAADREQLRYSELADVYGSGERRSVSALLERLHDDRSDRWSKVYARDQARHRRFWESKLGAVRLNRVTAAVVEKIGSDAAKAKGWSPRTQGAVLRYFVDALYYAERKLKWIDSRDNLSAVEIPKPRSSAKAYTLEQVKVLLPALERVDIRAGWIGHVAWQTGRRLSAIRSLRKTEVLMVDGRAVLRFPADTDKAKTEGEAVVVGRAAQLTVELMRTPGKYVLGHQPPTLFECERWMQAAEKDAGVEHIKKRAWHGVKRRWATETEGRRGREKMAGTTNQTLNRVYVQDDLEPKVRIAESLSEMVE